MGNSNSSQNIGFRYFLGLHIVLAQNKLRILELKFGEKSAWIGSKGGGESIGMNSRELFGGENSEGGVSGTIDVLDGNANQGKNDYLQSAIGGVISAYRGVTSLVFRQVYLGNNQYIKRLAVKAIDVEIAASWNVGKAYVNAEGTNSEAEICLIMDGSGSMAGANWEFVKSSVITLLESLKGTTNSVRLIYFHGDWLLNLNDDTEYTTINDCTDADYDTLIAWINALDTPVAATRYDWGFNRATGFFSTDTSATEFEGAGILAEEGATGFASADKKQRVVMFFTDGPTYNGQVDVDACLAIIDTFVGVDIYAFNIDYADTSETSQLDNTPADGVPNLSVSDDAALGGHFIGKLTKWADMNAVHIIRDAYVQSNGGDDSMMGDTFESVANTLYDEGMGLSVFWRNTRTVDEFVNDIKEHADVVTYIDRVTGKREIKAIRNDYDVGSLLILDTSNVTKWHDDIGRPLQENLPNQITIVYTKRGNGDTASMTLPNIAAIQQVERIIPRKVTYRGFSDDTIVGKVIMRDLSAMTVPLLSGTVDVTYVPADIQLGSAFILNNPSFGIDNVVVRLTERSEVGGVNPKITIKFVEDKFDTPAVAAVSAPAEYVVDTSPQNSPNRLFAEVGYYTLALDQTAASIDDLLAENPDLGVVSIAGAKPNNFHSSMDTATNAGAGWSLIDSGGFMPASELVESITETGTTSFDIKNNDTLRQVVAGSLCAVGEEIMRVDTMIIIGDNVTITVGRGCLDTTPKQHTSGGAILFYDGFTQTDPTQYTSGEIVEGKVLTKTNSGRLSLDAAETDSVTLNSRAVRPYPVGNLKMDGAFHPVGILDAVVPITWAHRDRTLQLTTSVEDYADASIGPEAGVEYVAQIRAIEGVEDFFADSNFFERRDFFTQEGLGVLIREVQVAADDSFQYDEKGVYDFFAPENFFDPSIVDFFAAVEPNFFATENFFDSAELPDFFQVVGGLAYRTQIVVRSSRDSYDNWQDAIVDGKHFMSAVNLELEAF